jgi:type I restriction enzyme S subunit
MKDNWEVKELNKIARLIKHTVMPNTIDCPYIGLEHIEQETLRLKSIGHSSEVNSLKYCFEENDILIVKLRQYFRKVIKPNFSGICSTDIFVIRSMPTIDQAFLYYLLSNWDFINIATVTNKGTRMPRADWNYLSNLHLNIPPLPEQKAIASVLSSLDDKIDLLHRQNKTLEAMADALFKQWFVVKAKDDWEERSLSNIADFINGLACQNYPPENDIDKLPVLKIRELNNGISSDSGYASSKIPQKFLVNNGDIIFSWSASILVKLWFGNQCVLNQHLFKVISNNYPKWFCYLWCKFYIKEFTSISHTQATTMGHIKREDLDKARVLIPSNKELDKMTKIMDPLINKIIFNNKAINTIKCMRDILLPNLLNGEVSVICN